MVRTDAKERTLDAFLVPQAPQDRQPSPEMAVRKDSPAADSPIDVDAGERQPLASSVPCRVIVDTPGSETLSTK